MQHPWTDGEDDDPIREPLEQGYLDPPRRKPPTAVGTATPRGPKRPHRPGGYHRFGMSRTRRIALAIMSGLLTTSGGVIGVVAWPGVITAAGLGFVVLGLAIGYQAIARGTEFERLGDYLMRRRENAGRGGHTSRGGGNRQTAA